MKICKVASVLYYLFAVCYAIGAGGVLLGWFFTGAASAMFGDIGMVPVSAAIVVVLIFVFAFIFIFVHSAIVLDSPRRNDVLVYYLYQASSICIMIIHLCAGIVLNYLGFLNWKLSLAFYGVLLTVPFVGAVALKKKRSEGVSVSAREDEEEEYEDEEEEEPTKVEPREKTNVQHGIYVLKGEYAGNFFTMDPEEEVILGTNPNVCNILFKDPKISRRHCKIHYSEVDQVYNIIDYSTNGTFFMDGTRLPMGRVQSCKLGTKICFENQNHVFQLM